MERAGGGEGRGAGGRGGEGVVEGGRGRGEGGLRGEVVFEIRHSRVPMWKLSFGRHARSWYLGAWLCVQRVL